MPTLAQIGNAVGQALQDFGSYTAQAAANANAVSRQAQSAQAAFNSNAMNTANSITDNRIASQYGFNSGMMAAANQYNTASWERAAEWNEMMWQKQADFNAQQAEIQRAWQERMSNTQYARAMKDMQTAGLNPILAAGGNGAGVPGGAAASVGGAQMSSAQSQMASGGLLGAEQANISGYTGQMETLSGLLGLLTALTASAGSAQNAFITLVDAANETVEDSMSPSMKSEAQEIRNDVEKISNGQMSIGEFISSVFGHRSGSMLQKGLADLLPEEWDPWPEETSGRGSNHGSNRAQSNQYARDMSAYKSWEKYSKPKG